jgi:hypothetical protein
VALPIPSPEPLSSEILLKCGAVLYRAAPLTLFLNIRILRLNIVQNKLNGAVRPIRTRSKVGCAYCASNVKCQPKLDGKHAAPNLIMVIAMKFGEKGRRSLNGWWKTCRLSCVLRDDSRRGPHLRFIPRAGYSVQLIPCEFDGPSGMVVTAQYVILQGPMSRPVFAEMKGEQSLNANTDPCYNSRAETISFSALISKSLMSIE